MENKNLDDKLYMITIQSLLPCKFDISISAKWEEKKDSKLKLDVHACDVFDVRSNKNKNKVLNENLLAIMRVQFYHFRSFAIWNWRLFYVFNRVVFCLKSSWNWN